MELFNLYFAFLLNDKLTYIANKILERGGEKKKGSFDHYEAIRLHWEREKKMAAYNKIVLIFDFSPAQKN